MGWRGGCLALGLVHGAVRHYCLGGCSALVVCARRSRPVRGAWAGAWCRVFPVSPFPPRITCTVCGGPSRPGVPYPRSLVHHSMRSVRSAGCVRFRSGLPRVSFVCVCARSPAAFAPPPPLPWLVWRAHLARSRCWALVGPFHAVRAPPRVLPRSRAPFGLLGGGGGPVSPLPGLGLRAPRGVGLLVWGVPAPGGGLGGGKACAPFSSTVRPGGPVGRGVALPRSVPLPSLGRQQSGCPWRRSGQGGPGPHTAPVRARLLSRGVVRVAALCVGAGSLVHHGSCGSRRLGRGGRPCSGLPPGCRGPAGGRGDHPLCLGGGGAAPPWLAGRWGGWGDRGGVAPWLPTSPLWGGRPAALCPVPLSSPAHPPQVYAFGRGRGATPGAGYGLPPAGQRGGEGGEGRPVSRPPRGVAGEPGGWGVALPRSVPLPSLGGQQWGRHWRRQVMGGAAPILLRFVVACRPRAWPVRRSCAPACRDPRRSRG